MIRCSILATLAITAASAADTYYTGDATAYTLGQVSSGNCNFMYDSGVGANYAAINAEQWNNTMNCGRCAEVSCIDSRCSDTSTSRIVYIVDQCPECTNGDLDLSPSTFKILTGSNPDRYLIKWKFVSCPLVGNIEYCTKIGSNNHWLAIQPANIALGVDSMQINNQTTKMVNSAFYFLIDNSSPDMRSVDVTITSIAGETISETLSLTANVCTKGTQQFATIDTTVTSTIQSYEPDWQSSMIQCETPSPTIQTIICS